MRELIDLDQNFFEKYHLKIERKNMVEKQTMRHFDSTSPNYSWEEKFPKVSTKPNDERKKHVNNLAFFDDSRKCRFINLFFFTARGFNACKIKGPVSDIWNVSTKRYGKQKINMSVSIRGPENDGIAQKITENSDKCNTKKSIFNSGSHVYVLTQEFTSMFFFYFYCT